MTEGRWPGDGDPLRTTPTASSIPAGTMRDMQLPEVAFQPGSQLKCAISNAAALYSELRGVRGALASS
jgi:hypothetical protein